MIRSPAVAGSFYPDRPERLQQTLERLVPAVRETAPARGVLVPHAGYRYSGAVAARTFAAVDLPGAVVLLGPNHSGRGHSAALMDRGEWEIPGSAVPVDSNLAVRILEECPTIRADETAHRAEHSLEVQLPFLRFLRPGFRFVPVCLAGRSCPGLVALGEGLARAVARNPGSALIVISTDLTHYEPQARAEAKDRLALERILALDPEGLWRIAGREGITMCGLAPAVAGLAACRSLGSRQATLVRYATSGDASGEREAVVGYAGVVIH